MTVMPPASRWWRWYAAALTLLALLPAGMLLARTIERAAMSEADILRSGKYAADQRATLLAERDTLRRELAAMRQRPDDTLAARRVLLARAEPMALRLDAIDNELADDAASTARILADWRARTGLAMPVLLVLAVLAALALLLWGARTPAAAGVMPATRVRWGAGVGAAWAAVMALLVLGVVCLTQALNPWPGLRPGETAAFAVTGVLFAANAASGWRLARHGRPRWWFLGTALLLAVNATLFARSDIDTASVAIWGNLSLGFALIAWPVRID